ncbi:snRNA-activating complex subunit 3 [Pelobates cultripes]|uniref:snRNA-activating protein complex subunit 3 n=2 Tax=Pelobates cultripes TaxID=61616 RepID=A0AAD1S8Y7_PELCU|nr:snRNA-activating complex subunit 3 [Pelobates cultripes]
MAEGVDENIPVFELTDTNTKVIHVGSFGNLWRERLTSHDVSLAEEPTQNLATDAELAADLGCTEETAAELKLLCSVDALKCGENEDLDSQNIPEDSNLVTLGIRRKVVERRKAMVIDHACRQETLRYEMEYHALGKRPQDSSNMIEEGELLLTLNIMYPVIFQKHKDYKPYATMLVLGSQKLTELRDAIKCVSDLQIGGEFSRNPDLAPENICKDLFKSAFFYFEGIFYNDMRYPECKDLSRNTIDWAESRDRGYGKFQSAKMEDYTFNDLRIKIGFPYLYCHQGDCEHIVTITDIRLIHYEDCLDRTLYPLQVKKHWFWTRKCYVCKIYTAKWVTNEDSLAPDDPCFFCDVCFRMLHYDTEGNKLGTFLAYPYVDPGTFN